VSALAPIRRWRQIALLVASGLALAACQSPVRAIRTDPTVAHRDLTRSAVTTGEASWPSRVVLLERGLLGEMADHPDAALAELHRAMIAEQGDADLLFALAEISYLHGQAAAARDHLMAAVVYAYAFLFPEDGGLRPGAFDPRLRIAANVYNWALTAALASEDGSEFVPKGGRFALPFGELDVAFDPAELRAGGRALYDLVPSAELEIHGLAMRYRTPGIGTALAASTRIAEGRSQTDIVAPLARVPLTALLRIAQPRRTLVRGDPLAASLELYLGWEEDSVTIAGERIALESEPTAALALTIGGAPVMEVEIFGFLGRLSGAMAKRPPLISVTPYVPGLVPVVFVHGTASSPARWAELHNRLQADPELRRHFQFWFFQYDSDDPIALSALRLREALTGAVALLDPEAEDPALQRMVLIGHSQGGLLVRMQVIETGDRLWNVVSRKPLDELRLSDQTRALLRSGLFLEPTPGVSRVVFIATPHRGSFLAAKGIVRRLARRLTHLPNRLAVAWSDLARNRDALDSPFLPTAVDNMAPGSPFILGLQAIPLHPSIAAHSIIAVEGTGPIEEGDDGVVEYQSAHIDGVESERVVSSAHSCQGNPHTIEEVRRILRLHAASAAAPIHAQPREEEAERDAADEGGEPGSSDAERSARE
jgi:pimeloyl-ACP methyl ester carboxylesterase